MIFLGFVVILYLACKKSNKELQSEEWKAYLEETKKVGGQHFGEYLYPR